MLGVWVSSLTTYQPEELGVRVVGGAGHGEDGGGQTGVFHGLGTHLPRAVICWHLGTHQRAQVSGGLASSSEGRQPGGSPNAVRADVGQQDHLRQRQKGQDQDSDAAPAVFLCFVLFKAS